MRVLVISSIMTGLNQPNILFRRKEGVLRWLSFYALFSIGSMKLNGIKKKS
jgi:hypothetical protein